MALRSSSGCHMQSPLHHSAPWPCGHAEQSTARWWPQFTVSTSWSSHESMKNDENKLHASCFHHVWSIYIEFKGTYDMDIWRRGLHLLLVSYSVVADRMLFSGGMPSYWQFAQFVAGTGPPSGFGASWRYLLLDARSLPPWSQHSSNNSKVEAHWNAWWHEEKERWQAEISTRSAIPRVIYIRTPKLPIPRNRSMPINNYKLSPGFQAASQSKKQKNQSSLLRVQRHSPLHQEDPCPWGHSEQWWAWCPPQST